MKRTTEIEHSLVEDAENCKQESIDDLINFIDEQDEIDGDTFENWLDNSFQHNGRDHEICDSNTEIYTYQLKCAYFDRESDLDEAYDNAGIGNREDETNYIQTAYYCYLSQEMNEFICGGLKDAWDNIDWDEKPSKKQIEDILNESL